MNKQRRECVDAIIEKLNDIQSMVNDVLDEESEYRDNIPDNLRNSEKYENAENNCDNLQRAIDSIDEAVSYLQEAQA